MCVCVSLCVCVSPDCFELGTASITVYSVNEFLLGFLLSDCMSCGYIARGSREQAELTQEHP